MMPYVEVLGVTPNLVLIFAASWAVVRGQDEAVVVVPLAGFIRDLLTSDPHRHVRPWRSHPSCCSPPSCGCAPLDTEFIPTTFVVAQGA